MWWLRLGSRYSALEDTGLTNTSERMRRMLERKLPKLLPQTSSKTSLNRKRREKHSALLLKSWMKLCGNETDD
jgi:hypothetical protein